MEFGKAIFDQVSSWMEENRTESPFGPSSLHHKCPDFTIRRLSPMEYKVEAQEGSGVLHDEIELHDTGFSSKMDETTPEEKTGGESEGEDMVSDSSYGVVRGIVLDNVRDGKSFTAWDVTREAKSDGLVSERHGALKRVVHEMDTNGELASQGYERTLISVPGAPAQPWLYHPVGTDPDDYVNGLSATTDDTTVVVSSIAAPAVVDSSSGDTLDDDPDDGDIIEWICTRDNRHRVNIPKGAAQKIGLNAGDDAYVRKNGSNEALIKSSPTPHATEVKYVVNCQGNVRMSPRILNDIFGATQTTVKVTVSGDTIVVR